MSATNHQRRRKDRAARRQGEPARGARLRGTDAMGGGFDEVIATVPAKRAAGPDEVAAAAVDLAREYADYVHGTTLTFDSGRLAV